MKVLPWENDRWLSRNGNVLIYDKLEHFLIAVFLVVGFALLFHGLPTWAIAVFVFMLGTIKEVYDGLVPYNGDEIEGFSIKDMLANIAGIVLGWIITGMFG